MSNLVPRTSPPQTRVRGFGGVDIRFGASTRPGRFLAGWWGIVSSVLVGALTVALLVGWVLLWVNRPGGPNLPLLVLGCIAFTATMAMIATLHNRFLAHWRLREAEALFLTGVSHSLRTPIGAIRASAQLLQSGAGDPQRRARLLDAIVHETRRLALRVDNVLETGRMNIERATFGGDLVDLASLLEEARAGMEGVVLVRGGEVRLDAPHPVLVRGDARALRLMMDNFLDNALNYAVDVPRVEMSLQRHDDFALVHIRDYGQGFEPGTAPDLFRRMFRGDHRGSGTGLGLPLAREIARGHGGEVYLHSDGPGQGALAEIWLPTEVEHG